jgi:predicted peptidase
LFVPSNYDPAKAWPLIVGLHGANRPYDWLMGYEGIIDFAQRDGFIMVTPLGYHPLGGFGIQRPTGDWAPKNATPAAMRVFRALEEIMKTLPPNISELSERDVMNVPGIIRKDFNVDPNRIYLWGHSMGGGGALHLAAKYRDIWAGVAVAAPTRPANFGELVEQFKQIPTLVLQSDADELVQPASTHELVAKMKELGMPVVYVEFKDGDHSLFMSKNKDNLSKVFSFFNIVQKNQRPAMSSLR